MYQAAVLLMRIATWNVNSIRARFDHVNEWLRSVQPDVLCVQETKVVDSEFPTDTFARLGYETVRVGQRSYNGVALISRHPIEAPSLGLFDATQGEDSRLIAGTILGVRVLSAYVPNGKNLDSPSYLEKLKWLGRLRKTLDATCSPDMPVALGGDFNIARDSRDVFDPEAMAGKIHFSPPEHRALEDVLAFGLEDCFRRREEAAGNFSWWDYRMGAFRRNRGLRIDYIFGTRKIAENLTAATIDKLPRTWEKPSDHAPVVIDFELP
jgi:exodeoxyribonuclease-3